MYRRASGLLVGLGLLFMVSFLCVKELDRVRLASEPVRLLRLKLSELEERARILEGQASAQKDTPAQGQASVQGEPFAQGQPFVPWGPESRERGLGILDVAVSGQRVVDYSVIEHRLAYDLPDSELEVLLRIVEAEAGTEDGDGRLLVANVVLNRMNSELFPDTVSEVVFQNAGGVYQFSPVRKESFREIKVSEETAEAVGRALMGEDISEGALYFVARRYVRDSRLRWFDENLTHLFVHGGHDFFK